MTIRILGTIFWALGNLIRRIDVLHLGWYMMGTGRKRMLPLWAWCNTKAIDENGRGWFSPYVEHRKPRDRMLFNSIGKFKARQWIDTDNMKHANLLDHYSFYATCGCALTHGRNCDCPAEARDWNYVTLFDFPWKRLSERLHEWLRNTRPLRYGLRREIFGGIACNLSYAGLSFSVSDEYFASRGTPFYIMGQVPEHVHVSYIDDVCHLQDVTLATA